MRSRPVVATKINIFDNILRTYIRCLRTLPVAHAINRLIWDADISAPFGVQKM